MGAVPKKPKLLLVNSAAIKSAALSIPGVNGLRPSISSALNIFSIRSTSVAFIILSIFCAKPNRLNKAATKIKDIFFIIYFLLLNSKSYLPSVKDSSFL